MNRTLTNVPPGEGGLLGINIIFPISSLKVVNNSCISHADLNSHLQPVQYSIDKECPSGNNDELLLLFTLPS